MAPPRVVIIGGGLAGLSAGCYGLASGLDVTIVEHNLALGGVCTAWQRGPYLIDGCIHWLTGGPFVRIYEELGIVPAVPLRTLDEFATYRHAADGWEVRLGRNLTRTFDSLSAIAPEDRDELARLREGAELMTAVKPPVDHAPELETPADRLRGLWQFRHGLGTLAHFRKPVGVWVQENLRSPRLRGLFLRLMPAESPALTIPFVLGYLSEGWLSRPIGGTARFRDALIGQYYDLGGDAILDTTVEEILTRDGRATGVRLTDGTLLEADVVISTSSVPETVFRLLAGRYGARAWGDRMEHWKMFQPIVLASFGVAIALTRQPSTLLVDGIDPFTVGGHRNEHLYLRIYNEEPGFAPPGHCVVQTMVATEYDWWATRGPRYQDEKEAAADRLAAVIDRQLHGMKAAVRMVDVATPLTFWRNARAWRGAFEGWLPGMEGFRHVSKELPGLKGFYLAGQWVEPGGGVPMATMSGRHAIEIACSALGRPFCVPIAATSHAS